MIRDMNGIAKDFDFFFPLLAAELVTSTIFHCTKTGLLTQAFWFGGVFSSSISTSIVCSSFAGIYLCKDLTFTWKYTLEDVKLYNN